MLDKIILAPYYLILKLRHALYNSGIFKVHTCKEVPTICIGNITAGGTGKTPHTEMIIKTLLDNPKWADKNIAVLSRGHKRKSSGFQQVYTTDRAAAVGDEPLQIKKKFPNITVAVDRTRVEGINFLLNREKMMETKRGRKCKNKDYPKSDIIILDDAFQYRSLKALFNIVLVDYNRPTYKDMLLPFGRLRDLPERFHYADIIIVTKCPPYLNEWEKSKWAQSLGIDNYNTSSCSGIDKKGKQQTVLFTSINYCPLQPIFENGDARYVYSKKLILFSGIAKDTPLRQYLSDHYKIIRRFNFADHHKYGAFDIMKIQASTKGSPTAVVATTEKDSQRILDYKKIPDSLKKKMFMVPIEVSFLSLHEKEVFETLLSDALDKFYE